jgi:hypothetical protein
MSRLRRLVVYDRFFDRAVRTVQEYYEKVEYIHLNPVRAGPVERPEDWAWSSVRDYARNLNAVVSLHPRLSKLAEVPGGFAPCFAERLCLSGRNLRNMIVFRRVQAAPSRGGKQVV